ncbi:MAG: heme A synthase [Rhodobacteraceae bacterium]|nr:heme A synthase [Paracoccaceae bacterium]
MSKPRSIFEDVSDGKPVPDTPKGGVIDSGKRGSRRAIARWLMALFVLVSMMIVVGGLTRLTDSGLSITEWKPVTGAVPPMSAEAWEGEFERYQQIPEYQLQNKNMTLAEFKSIYWWEWGHRQLGRLIGLVWAVGFGFFLVTKRIPVGWTPRLLGIGILGGLQGAVGWWMVSSGLTGRMIDVASYRLAIHLGLAFVILGTIIWLFWQLNRSEIELMQARRSKEPGLVRLSSVLTGLILVQILLGALVAGIDAGRGYIDWPMMNGEFLPSESFDYTPLWSNFFENPALVQFDHRMVGYLVLAVSGFVWWVSRSSAVITTRRVFDLAVLLIAVQMVFGIVTVLYAAPWQSAILHQIGAIMVICAVLRGRFLALYPLAQSIR